MLLALLPPSALMILLWTLLKSEVHSCGMPQLPLTVFLQLSCLLIVVLADRALLIAWMDLFVARLFLAQMQMILTPAMDIVVTAKMPVRVLLVWYAKIIAALLIMLVNKRPSQLWSKVAKA